MGFRAGAYATVWSVEPKSDVNTQIRISISKKNKQTGEYEQDFSGFVACIGSAAAKKAVKLRERDRIRLKDVDVTTTYNKDTKIQYTNYKCFDFLIDGDPGFGDSAVRSEDPAPSTPVDDGEIDDSDLPF